MPSLFQSAVERRLRKRATPDYGERKDGSKKGKGWLGPIDLGGGNVATEFTTSSVDIKVNGKEIDFPTLVPTLSKNEIALMQNDIIPNNKPIPKAIVRKAIEHARKQLAEGKSVFAD